MADDRLSEMLAVWRAALSPVSQSGPVDCDDQLAIVCAKSCSLTLFGYYQLRKALSTSDFSNNVGSTTQKVSRKGSLVAI